MICEQCNKPILGKVYGGYHIVVKKVVWFCSNACHARFDLDQFARKQLEDKDSNDRPSTATVQ